MITDHLKRPLAWKINMDEYKSESMQVYMHAHVQEPVNICEYVKINMYINMDKYLNIHIRIYRYMNNINIYYMPYMHK